MSDIRALDLNSLWNCFADLNAVPRPSKREDRVVAFVREFAKRHGLTSMLDSAGNVIVKKPATPDRQDRPAVMAVTRPRSPNPASSAVSRANSARTWERVAPPPEPPKIIKLEIKKPEPLPDNPPPEPPQEVADVITDNPEGIAIAPPAPPAPERGDGPREVAPSVDMSMMRARPPR